MINTAENSNEKNRIECGVLYIVATPIGNMSDLSERAIKVLSEVDFIAAEDTRVASKLLMNIGAKKNIISYHEHNSQTSGVKIIERLKDGESCALVSDAGTPAINDPGAELVKLCANASVKVTAIPGPCAAITALILSGLDTSRFTYEGFLTSSSKEREKQLERIRLSDATIILYEAPHRLTDTLAALFNHIGDRNIALCRELTKLNEEILRLKLSEAITSFSEKKPRGEFVIIIEGLSEPDTAETFWNDMAVREHFTYYSKKLAYTKNDAIKAVAKDRGVAKNVIYKELLDD